MIKAGTTFKDRNGVKHTIVNTFQDGEETIITHKWWSKIKQRWYYISEELWSLEIAFEYGSYKLTRK